MNKALTIFCAICLLSFFACNKEEGTGGTGTIEGRVFQVVHNDDNYSLSADTMVAARQDVYLIYGNDGYFGDDAETDRDGRYRFRYLNPGTYTLYAYSQTPDGQRLAESRTVTLRRGEKVEVDDIFIHQGKAYGTSLLKGWVKATYFDKNGNTIRTSWPYEHRVYIQRMGEDYHFDDTRVGLNGIFYFQKLTPGTYVVTTYGQLTDETPYPVSDTVVIDQANGIFISDTLNIRIKA